MSAPVTAAEGRRHGAGGDGARGAEIGDRAFTNMITVAIWCTFRPYRKAQPVQRGLLSWEPRLEALIATVTGSARPVDKGRLKDDDLAVIVGVTATGQGAQVRHVEGHLNTPPSTEAVEMMEMDEPLPRIVLGDAWDVQTTVPVIRSRLHGHRGVSAYDPRYVQFAPLDAPYYRYLVSCGTGAQAEGIRAAFSRRVAAQSGGSPSVVFTVLPGHGVMIVEKWVLGPCRSRSSGNTWTQVISLSTGWCPRGQMAFEPDDHGLIRLVTL